MVGAGLSAPTQSSAGIAANAAAPAVSYRIGQEFKRRNAEGSLGHLLAHATLGGLTAAAGGNDPLAGALSSGGAEAAARYISGLFGQKDGSRLSTEQKETVTAITSLIGTAAGAALGSTPADVAQGSLNARNSVENNFLLPRDTRHISAESARLVQKVAQLAAAKLSPEEMKYLYIETFVDEIRAINRSNRSEQEKQRAYRALLQKHERVSNVVENVFKTIPIGHKDRDTLMQLVKEMQGLITADYYELELSGPKPNLFHREWTAWTPSSPFVTTPSGTSIQRIQCAWTNNELCFSIADAQGGRIGGRIRLGTSRTSAGTKPTAAAHTPPAAAPVPRPPAGQENRRTSLASPSAAGQGKSGHTAPATPTQPNRPSTRERVHRNNQETERGNQRSQFRQHAQNERKIRTGAESSTMPSGGNMARENASVPRPQHLAHPDNAIGRNKQPSAGGQRTSGGNPAIDRDPYSPSSVQTRIDARTTNKPQSEVESKPKRNTAPEHNAGELTKQQFDENVKRYLGKGYEDKGKGRFLSTDGMRQTRYGDHETRNPNDHHGHFEAYDKSAHEGGEVIENSRVVIKP